MQSFIVLRKRLDFKSPGVKSFEYETIDMKFWFQEAVKESHHLAEYTIDENTVKIENLNGVLYLLCHAFKK